MNLRRWLIGSAWALAGFAAEIPVVENPSDYSHERLGLTVVRGDVRLPARGLWRVVPGAGDAGLRQVQLVPPKEVTQRLLGERGRAATEQRRTRRGQSPLRQIHWTLREYARDRRVESRMLPSELDDARSERVENLLTANPWSKEFPGAEPPFYCLIDDAPLVFPEHTDKEKPARRRNPKNDDLLAFELRPHVSDGKHWVLLANGRTKRVAIDLGLERAHGVTITPVLEADVTPRSRPDTAVYRTYALVPQDNGGEATVLVRNRMTQEEMQFRWSFADLRPGDESILSAWAEARGRDWALAAGETQSQVLSFWLSRQKALYGVKAAPPDRRRRRNNRRTTSVFNVLGGRAAVRETLQMQMLGGPTPDKDAAPSVPVAGIPGVEVKSHPFGQMLADKPRGRLALADSVPLARFFVCVTKPEALIPFLGKGADFLFSLGSTGLGSSAHHDVTTRYLANLGMDREWLKLVLASGMVQQIGIVMPDLFLVDGTDVTVLSRVPRLVLMKRLLSMIGVADIVEDRITTQTTKDGRDVFWSTSGDLLLTSTSRTELQRVLDVRRTGAGSLGKSAEFGYMLTQLPVTANTRMLVYFSDPFIRRLVGPEVKIGQLRRMRARATMEGITAAALLHQLDAHQSPPSVERLARLGYIPERTAGEDYVLDADLAVSSSTYGSTVDMTTLSERPVELATPAEAEAYKQYVDNYTRFWRRFFDPIAVRLDDTDDGGLELATFILPLLDSRMYDGLRQMLGDGATARPLAVPELGEKPVMMLSMNLSDPAWAMVVSSMDETMRRFSGLDQRLFDELGPSVHLAVRDADPIIALGSGDILGAFGGGANVFGGRSEMLGIPLMLSILTRPCALLIELRDPDRAKEILRSTASQNVSGRSGWEMRAGFYRLSDRDAWVYSLDLFGMIRLRFGIEVRDGYLIVKNLPWSQDLEVTGRREARLNGVRLALYPSAVQVQLPALHNAAADQQRRTAMDGIGYLLPMVLTGGDDVETARQRHRALFGFAPAHPAGGTWTSENSNLGSTVFGSLTQQQQPDHAPEDRAFGLLQDIEHLHLDMQLEDTGLRSTIRWKMAQR